MDDESFNKTSLASKLKNKTPDTDSEESFKASQQSQSKSSVPPKITLCTYISHNFFVFGCLFDLILYVHSTIFQLFGTGLPGLNQY